MDGADWILSKLRFSLVRLQSDIFYYRQMLLKRTLPLLGWLLTLLLCGWLVWRTPIVTDLTLFIPRSDATAQFLLEQLRTGPAARLVLIGLTGGSGPNRATVSGRLAEHLRASGLFLRVLNGGEHLDTAEQQQLFTHRYLLSPAIEAGRFSADGLRAALQQRLRELGSPVAALEKRLLPADPTGELLTLLRTWQGTSAAQPDKQFGVWFSRDGERALLLAESRAAGFDLEAQQQVVTAIREAFATAQQGTSVELLLSGPGVIATLSQSTIRAEAEWLSSLATTLVITLLLLAYRSPRIVLLSTLPLLSPALVAIAAVGLLFGSLYGLTLAFGVTLIGIANDYPIHFFSHLRREETVAHGLQQIWPTVRLGVTATIVSYLAMMSTDFVGLMQLSAFSIIGLLTAAVFTRWVLPSCLPPVWAPRHAFIGGAWTRPLLFPPRTSAVVLLGIGLLAVLILRNIQPPIWEDDLAAFNPIPKPLLTLDRQLRADLGAPEAGHLLLIQAPDAETALQRSETAAARLQPLIADGLLSGFDSPARYLPSQLTQHARQATLPEPDQLRDQLNQAMIGLPFKPGLFESFLTAVEQARSGPLLTAEELRGTTLGLRIHALLFANRSHWVALLPLTGVSNPPVLAARLAEAPLEATRYVDSRAETSRLIAGFRDTALVRLGWGAGLITFVLWLGLRAWPRVLAVLLPVALAMLLTVTVLLGSGERLSLFHLISLLLVLGLGIDYSLFFSRPEAELTARQRTLHAVLVCSSSTLIVFGMLALSTLPVLSAIGKTVAIGVLASFIMALILARQVAALAANPT